MTVRARDQWKVEPAVCDEGQVLDGFHLVNQFGEIMDDSFTTFYDTAEHECNAWNAGEYDA